MVRKNLPWTSTIFAICWIWKRIFPLLKQMKTWQNNVFNCIILAQNTYYRLKSLHFVLERLRWGCNSVVECPLRMRKVPGSIPGTSTILFNFLRFVILCFFLMFQSSFKWYFMIKINYLVINSLFHKINGKYILCFQLFVDVIAIRKPSSAILDNICVFNCNYFRLYLR